MEGPWARGLRFGCVKTFKYTCQDPRGPDESGTFGRPRPAICLWRPPSGKEKNRQMNEAAGSNR